MILLHLTYANIKLEFICKVLVLAQGRPLDPTLFLDYNTDL